MCFGTACNLEADLDVAEASEFAEVGPGPDGAVQPCEVVQA